MITISKVEYNTDTNTFELWQYVIDTDRNNAIIRSYLEMSMPVAPWADKWEVQHQLIKLAIIENRWMRGE